MQFFSFHILPHSSVITIQQAYTENYHVSDNCELKTGGIRWTGHSLSLKSL